MTGADADRFMAKVSPEPNTGCWLWTAATAGKGYGYFRYGDRMVAAHRVSYAHFIGPIPRGAFVTHRCDIPVCVNPAHLELGTNATNMQDAATRGRIARGERHHGARLTENDVREIRSLHAGGMGCAAIAARYGMSQTHIYDIAARRYWAHVQ